MSWLGKTFEPAQLRFNDLPHERGLEDPKVAATSEVHADSLGRWREELSEAEISEIGSEAAELWATVDPEGRCGRFADGRVPLGRRIAAV
jgi:hypothetical protein